MSPLPTGTEVDGAIPYAGQFFDKGAAVYNVMHPDFGAKGDGTTDDGGAWNSVVAGLPSTGGTVFVPAGSYKLTTAFSFGGKDNIVLWLMPGVVLTGSSLPSVSANNHILDWRSATFEPDDGIFDTISIGSTPFAGQGLIRWPSTATTNIAARNAGNSTDLTMLNLDTADDLQLGGTSVGNVRLASDDGVIATLQTSGTKDAFLFRHDDECHFIGYVANAAAAKAPEVLLNKARGTIASPTAVQSGDRLGLMSGWGFDSTGYREAAQLHFLATQTFTTTTSTHTASASLRFLVGAAWVTTFLAEKQTVFVGRLGTAKTAGTSVLWLGGNSTTDYDLASASAATSLYGMSIYPSLKLNGVNHTTHGGLGVQVASLADGSSRTLTNQVGISILDGIKDSDTTITNAIGLEIKNITIGSNDWAIKTGTGSVEFGGNVGVGVTPGANADLTLEAGRLMLKESATPTADTNYGKVYTKTDNKLYFQDGAGTEHELAFA